MPLRLWCCAGADEPEPVPYVLQLESGGPSSASEETWACRICLEEAPLSVPPCIRGDVAAARAALGKHGSEVVHLCDCTSAPYHTRCLLEQLETWANRRDWDRRCDVCTEPWWFMPPQTEEIRQAPAWVEWVGGEFRVAGLPGVRMVVGPGTGSSPAGPAIPLADAWQTVEMRFSEPCTVSGAGGYLTGDGLSALRVPWRRVRQVLGVNW